MSAQSRGLEELNIAWLELAAEFDQTAARVQQTQLTGDAARDMFVILLELDGRLVALEHSAVAALGHFIRLLDGIGDA